MVGIKALVQPDSSTKRVRGLHPYAQTLVMAAMILPTTSPVPASALAHSTYSLPFTNMIRATIINTNAAPKTPTNSHKFGVIAAVALTAAGIRADTSRKHQRQRPALQSPETRKRSIEKE